MRRLGVDLSLFFENVMQRTNLRRVLANISWLSLDRFFRLGVGLFVGIWVARYLGPEKFGLFNYALAFVSLFSAFSSLGLDNIVIRDIVHDPSHELETLGSAFVLKIVGGGVTLLLSIVFIRVLRPDNSFLQSAVLVIAVGAIFQSLDVIDFWFQSQIQSKYVVLARNAAFSFVAVIRVVFVLLKAPLIAFAVANAIEIAIGAMGLVIVYSFKKQMISSWRFSTARVKTLLRSSWPLIISSVAITLYLRIDVIMMGQMLNDQSVGVYAAATRISEIWYFIPMVIISSVQPSIIEAKKQSEKIYYDKLQRLFDLVTSLALLIAVFVMFMSGFIIHLLYKEEYMGAGTILAVHIWGLVFVFMGVAQSPWDITENLTKLAMIRTILGVIVNILLNLILLPAYAGLGAAISTVISYSVSGCVANILTKRTQIIFKMQMRSVFPVIRLYRSFKAGY